MLRLTEKQYDNITMITGEPDYQILQNWCIVQRKVDSATNRSSAIHINDLSGLIELHVITAIITGIIL